MQDIYCLDSSSLIDLKKNIPSDVFPSLWTRLDKLVDAGRIISHIEVYKEVADGNDSLAQWTKRHKSIFQRIDAQQIDLVREIECKFPALAHPNKERANADPFLIALAIIKNQERTLFPAHYLLVTEERIKGNQIRIPVVCKHYGIECIRHIDMLRREGWKF